MQRCISYAEAIDVTWEFTSELDPHHPGRYADEIRHMWVLDGMTSVKTLCAFAHELGHATLEHSPSLFAWINERQERAADEWAAHFLVDVDDYRHAKAKYGDRLDWIAQDLGVLKRIVLAYERSLVRIGNTVYINPKMGAEQAARITA